MWAGKYLGLSMQRAPWQDSRTKAELKLGCSRTLHTGCCGRAAGAEAECGQRGTRVFCIGTDLAGQWQLKQV